MSEIKRQQLGALAERRRKTELATHFGQPNTGYRHIGDFQNGVFDCCHVSPWSISACNLDSPIMIVGQDWSSAEHLEKVPPNPHIIECGYDPGFPTNINLDRLFNEHFETRRADFYLTNVFPFVKPGRATRRIPMAHLARCATDFLLPQIDIVAPRAVICLGLRTFNALMRALHQPGAHRLASAIERPPYAQYGALIFAAAHTGSLGTKNRGVEQVDEDWKQIKLTVSTLPA